MCRRRKNQVGSPGYFVTKKFCSLLTELHIPEISSILLVLLLISVGVTHIQFKILVLGYVRKTSWQLKSFLSPHKIISNTSQPNWSSAKNFYSRIESIYPPVPRIKLL